MARKIAQSQFGLDLRIAACSIEDLRQRGFVARVGKFQLSENVHLAMFSGSGFAEAERLLKSPGLERQWEQKFPPIEHDPRLFEGLECRWNPLKSKNGVVLSLIVTASSGSNDEARIYSEVLSEIERITGSSDNRPISSVNLPLSWPPKDLGSEVKVRAAHLKRFRKARYWIGAGLTSLIAAVLIRFRKSLGPFDPNRYLNELVANSDFQKFENALKLVLDCSVHERDRLLESLESLRSRQLLCCGAHSSDSAMMTCMVFSLQNHVHFIDGSNGGYALAAQQLKKQLEAAR